MYLKIHRVIDDDHPERLNVLNNLGHLYCWKRMGEAARQVLDECYLQRKIKHGADHPDTLTAMDWLG